MTEYDQNQQNLKQDNLKQDNLKQDACDPKHYQFQTKAVHGTGASYPYGANTIPIVQSSGFAYDSAEELADTFAGKKFGYIYSRISNPTITALENKLNTIENGQAAIAVSSGLAGISLTIQALAQTGDTILSSASLFGGTYYLFKNLEENFNIQFRYINIDDISGIKAAITPTTKAIFCESIGNPKCDIPNLKALSQIAQAANIPLIVDGTLTSPYLLNAKEHGIDVMIHSTTKYICGHGTAIGGVVIDTGHFKWKQSKSDNLTEFTSQLGNLGFQAKVRQLAVNHGTTLSPFDAFLLSTGIETLALRLDRHCENALALARFLESHPGVENVNYPGLPNSPYHDIAKSQYQGKFGALLTLRVGSQKRAFQVLDALKLAKTVVNLGDARTLVVHPASTIYRKLDRESQEKAGVYDDLIRVSVGIEDAADIIADFKQALEVKLK